jgi:lipid-binding SYLF domain-containing protein
MKKLFKYPARVMMAAAVAVLLFAPKTSLADSGAEIDREVSRGLQILYAHTPKAKELGKKAKGILVFPGIIKGGFILGGQYGEGALRKNGKTTGYYNTVAASYGLQAGLQKFGYAMFFMTEPAMKYLDKSGGWELGGAPNITVVDKGLATSLSTTTLQNAIYVFYFHQKGLMAGLGIQGSKITRIYR